MKNFLVNFCLIIVSFLGSGLSYASEVDTNLMCSTLLDSRVKDLKEMDEHTQTFGHVQILELAYSDTAFNEGLKKINEYSTADEVKKTKLMRSVGFKKAVQVCAQAHGFSAFDVDQLLQSVIGLIDTTSLISSRESSFLALSYLFNKATSQKTNSYNEFMSLVLQRAFEQISTLETAVQYQDLNHLQEMLLNLFAGNTQLSDIPLEVLEQLDKLVLQKHSLQVAIQTEAGKVLMGIVTAHENFWKHWSNNTLIVSDSDKARAVFLNSLFVLQSIYAATAEEQTTEPSVELKAERDAKIAELLIQLNAFDYSLRNLSVSE